MKSLLLIEDDQEIVECLKMLLELEGYKVVSASDGIEALRIIKGLAFDVIVTDNQMNGMNGVEFIQIFKDLKNKTPVIMLSGSRSLKSKADYTMLKPPDIDELVKVIEAIKCDDDAS